MIKGNKYVFSCYKQRMDHPDFKQQQISHAGCCCKENCPTSMLAKSLQNMKGISRDGLFHMRVGGREGGEPWSTLAFNLLLVLVFYYQPFISISIISTFQSVPGIAARNGWEASVADTVKLPIKIPVSHSASHNISKWSSRASSCTIRCSNPVLM